MPLLAPSSTAAVAPLCSQYRSCGACESAAGDLRCGWCATSSSCLTGSPLGPVAPNTCAPSSWTFQSCATDATCAQIGSNCDQCLLTPNCSFCTKTKHTHAASHREGSLCLALTLSLPLAALCAGLSDGDWLVNSCIAGSAGPRPQSAANCTSFLVVGQSAQCPAPQPALPSPPYPTAGTAAIAMLGVVSLLWILRAILYCGCCCGRAWTPVLGNRLRPGMLLSLRDYSRGWRLSLPFFLGGLSLGLKVLALALDLWEITRPSFDYGITEPQRWWGCMRVRWSEVPVGETDDGSSSYAEFCDAMRDAADPTDADSANNLKMCRTLQAAAGLTLLSCCISLLLSVATTLYGLWLLAGETSVARRGVAGWRIVAFAQLCGLSCCVYWLLSAHLLIVHLTPHGPASLGVSFPMMVSAWILDLILLVHSNQAVGFTPAPLAASAFADAAGRPGVFRGSVVVEQPIPYAMLEADGGEESASSASSDGSDAEGDDATSPRQFSSAPPYYALDSPSAANRSQAAFIAEGQARAEGQPAPPLPSAPLQPGAAVQLEGQLNYQ